MRPLADMAPQERAQCLGMWCYIFDREGEPPIGEGIIAGYKESDDGRTLAVIDHPHPDAGKWGHELNKVSSRPDLPRAWQADGRPPAGEWEYRPEQLETWGEWKPIAVTTNKAEAESWTTTKQFKDATTRVMKRRIGQWEEA